MPGFRRLSLLFAACALISAQALAKEGDETPASTTRPAEAPDNARAPKPLAVAASVVPGVLVHGAGSWVDGDDETALRLLEAEAAGLGLILAGGVPIALTGASRYVIGPAAAVSIVGFGLFTVSWAADVYAVTAPEGGWGRARNVTPWIQTELGYRRVQDPRFAYDHFVVQSIDVRAGRFRLMPSAWWSADARNSRLRLVGGYRAFGPTPREGEAERPDGSALDLEAALTRHDYGDDGFKIGTFELFARSRTDLVRVAKPLEGSFFELGLGGAVQQFAYEVPGVSIPSDLETMLLARFGFGVYVGGPSAPDGEFLLYYDHRHDDYAAGLLSTVPTSGVLGHFGLDGRMFFSENWGGSGQAQVGAALVAGLSLVFREDLR